MSDKKLVVIPALLKAHVGSFTRKDGTFVKEHDTSVQAKQQDPYGHPNVVGHAEKLQGGGAEKAHGMHFAGKEFSASGKVGTSNHDGTPVRHFRELTKDGSDSGEHVWMDHGGRVHADDTSSVKRLRAAHEEHQKASVPAAGPDHHNSMAAMHEGAMNSATDPDQKSMHTRAMNLHKKAASHGNEQTVSMANELSAKLKTGQAAIPHQMKPTSPAEYRKQGAVVQGEAAKNPAPMDADAVKAHAMAAGAKHRSGVMAFSKPEHAHSFADQTKGSKGSAFVMKHADHAHHVVVNGADAQRMEKNGYQHVKPGAGPMQKSVLFLKPDLIK